MKKILGILTCNKHTSGDLHVLFKIIMNIQKVIARSRHFMMRFLRTV